MIPTQELLKLVEGLTHVALVGGAMSGKSRALRELAPLYPHAHFQGEAASALFSTGPESPPRDSRYNAEFNRGFSQGVQAVERLANMYALHKGLKYVVHERGVPDLIAYVDGGEEEFERLAGMTLKQAAWRYNITFYFELPSFEILTRMNAFGNNPNRQEDVYEEMVLLDERTRPAYEKYSKVLFPVPVFERWEDRLSYVKETLDRILLP